MRFRGLFESTKISDGASMVLNYKKLKLKKSEPEVLSQPKRIQTALQVGCK